MKTSDFKDLRIWNQSMDIITDVYKLIKKLPPEERHALADQIRRCAVSIPSNIAEGQARNSKKEFIHFLSISRGSIAELQTQLLISVRLDYLEEIEVSEILLRLKHTDKMISSLMCSLER